MTNNVINSSYNGTKNETWLPLPECILWLVVFITEFLAIVSLNIITIIVFVKKPQLIRKSTYLIIHLAIVDLLVGAVTIPSIIYWVGAPCDLWEIDWHGITYLALAKLFQSFPFASLINIAIISLERVHATFRPFKHRFIKKWVYGVLIAVTWIITAALLLVTSPSTPSIWFLWSFLSLLFVICVSYISILIEVRLSRRPRHHSPAGVRERKLTRTLFLVTLASLLTWIPVILELIFRIFYRQYFPSRIFYHIVRISNLLYFANSLVNPIIYAVQMPELRQGIKQIIFCRTPSRLNQFGLALRHL